MASSTSVQTISTASFTLKPSIPHSQPTSPLLKSNPITKFASVSSTPSHSQFQFDAAPALRPCNITTPRATLKRRRASSFLDDDAHTTSEKPRKKRRLRLTLVTSRLSHPFAFPSTYVVGSRPSTACRVPVDPAPVIFLESRRGEARRGAGARRSRVLHRAAVHNWSRMRQRRRWSDLGSLDDGFASWLDEEVEEETEDPEQTFNNHDSVPQPPLLNPVRPLALSTDREENHPSPRSSPSVSNYQAIDEEEDLDDGEPLLAPSTLEDLNPMPASLTSSIRETSSTEKDLVSRSTFSIDHGLVSQPLRVEACSTHLKDELARVREQICRTLVQWPQFSRIACY